MENKDQTVKDQATAEAAAAAANAGLNSGILAVKATSGKTVSVACKLPNGLHLDIVSTPGLPVRRVSVRGSNAGAVGMNGQRKFPDALEVAGFGITQNVPKDFWDEWLRLNAHTPTVVHGLIFGYEKLDSTIGRAREQGKGLKTGLEGIDQTRPGIGIETKQTGKLETYNAAEPSPASG